MTGHDHRAIEAYAVHLVAARKCGAEVLLTLDLRDFQALVRKGDPRVEAPR